MIINDHGFKGVILRLGKGFSKVHLNDDLELTAGAGLLKKKALSLCAANNLAGLTGLTGVPGQIGGGLAMNAGTKYGTIADSLVIIKYADSLGKIKIIDQNRISSNYRSSLIPANSIALEAVFRLKRATGPKDYVKQKIDSILAERKSKQPLRFPSCGSTFKNPPGHSAGRLIEACGLKGLKSGNAEISEKHANFILNLGNASSADILFLIEKAQKRVKEKFDISLEREVIILGEKGPEN
jgi:UDP-N-acetylmuramate dehydrogenase